MSPDAATPAGRRVTGIAVPRAVRLRCHGCGHEVPIDETYPFRCPAARPGDDVDHVLRRVLDAPALGALDARALFLDSEPNPFRKYSRLLYSFEAARSSGVPESDYRAIVDRLDAAVADADGRGFQATPFAPATALAEAIGLEPDRFWVKDETGNVSGSHKARHLFGIMLWLEIQRRVRGEVDERPLAIASCGNAALAAAVVARAAGRSLDVFVPPDANRRVVERLTELGARLTRCPRRDDDPEGDPCYLRFLEASAGEALPFTVQGNQNGLAVEGGSTLVWEVISALLERGERLDHLLVQVGGGGLASACIQGLRDARALGLIERLPRLHTVQTRGGFPLRRAYDRLTARLLDSAHASETAIEVSADDERARRLRDEVPAHAVADELRYAATHRSEFMWPWETPPQSIAYGILDDETYDWLAVMEGMLETGGIPLVASEETLAEAHRLVGEKTEFRAEPTGTAGLAGLLDLVASGVVGPGESVGILLTGTER